MFYIKLKKYMKYLFFGILTTAINVISFYFLIKVNIDYKLANVIAFIIAVTFAFFTNKAYVFESKTENIKDYGMEFFKFILSRVATFIVDFFGMIFFVEILIIDELISKVLANVIVIFLNYIFSELFVFKK